MKSWSYWYPELSCYFCKCCLTVIKGNKILVSDLKFCWLCLICLLTHPWGLVCLLNLVQNLLENETYPAYSLDAKKKSQNDSLIFDTNSNGKRKENRKRGKKRDKKNLKISKNVNSSRTRHLNFFQVQVTNKLRSFCNYFPLGLFNLLLLELFHLTHILDVSEWKRELFNKLVIKHLHRLERSISHPHSTFLDIQ